MSPTGRKKRSFHIPLSARTILGVLLLTLILCGVSLMIGARIHNIRQARQYETDTWQLARTIALMMDNADAVKYIEQVREIYEQVPPELMEEIDRKEKVMERYVDDSSVPSNDEEFTEAVQDYMDSLDKFSAYFDKVATPAYYNTESVLPAVARENDVFSIHIFIIDPLRKHMISVFYALQDSEYLFGMDAAGDISEFYEGFDDYVKDGSSGHFSLSYEASRKRGTYFSSIAPYYHPQTGEIIAYVEVVDSYDDVAIDQEGFIHQYVLTIFLAASVLALISYLITHRIIVTPILQMSKAANAYTVDTSRSETTALVKSYFSELNIHTGDEIETLAQAMKRMEQELSSYVRRLTKVTAQTERINTELTIASGIQEALLPKTFPPFPDHHEFDLYASMIPAREIGGDFYDLYLIDDDHLALTIADVSGKGVPASLFMAISKTMLKDRTLLGGTPASVLKEVNQRLLEGNDSNMFCTVWLGILTLSTGELICANAGHENPALRRSGMPFKSIVTRHGPLIGVLDHITIRDEYYQLEPGDVLFLYTDGLTEAIAPDKSQFTESRLIYTLNQLDKDDAPLQIIEKTTARIEAFMEDAEQYDDMTTLCLVYIGK